MMKKITKLIIYLNKILMNFINIFNFYCNQFNLKHINNLFNFNNSIL